MPIIKIKNSDKTFIVDAEDLQRCSEVEWELFSGVQIKTRIGRFRKPVSITKFITDEDFIDHKDRNIFNNSRSNFRRTDGDRRNNCNRTKSKNKSSIYLGVSLIKSSGKWRASISHNYKEINLGTFEDETEAARAYNCAALFYHKEFANLNNLPEITY